MRRGVLSYFRSAPVRHAALVTVILSCAPRPQAPPSVAIEVAAGCEFEVREPRVVENALHGSRPRSLPPLAARESLLVMVYIDTLGQAQLPTMQFLGRQAPRELLPAVREALTALTFQPAEATMDHCEVPGQRTWRKVRAPARIPLVFTANR